MILQKFEKNMLNINRRIDNKLVKMIAPYLPPKVAHELLFHINHQYSIRWNNLRTYDEKLTYAMAFLIGEPESLFADKYRARKYIIDQGFEELLPQIYGVWDKASDINIQSLPRQCVIKTNNGHGDPYCYICLDTETIDIKSIKGKFEEALHSPFWKTECEYQYRYIKPLVFAEEYLNDGNGDRPIDYKIYCFDGKPEYIMVCSNRGIDLKLNFYDLDWNELDIAVEEKKSSIQFEKPEQLNIMIYAAERLSSIFPTARIDFYDIYGKVYIGEITITPFAGNHPIKKEWQYIWGEKVDLSKCIGRFIRLKGE